MTPVEPEKQTCTARFAGYRVRADLGIFSRSSAPVVHPFAGWGQANGGRDLNFKALTTAATVRAGVTSGGYPQPLSQEVRIGDRFL